MPPFEIPFPASTTIKSPVFDRENTVFPFSLKNKALKRPLIHELILIRAISLAPVRKTVRRSMRKIPRLFIAICIVGILKS